MGYADSSADHSLSNSKQAALHQLKALYLNLFRRTKEFLEAQTLPYVAHKVCEAYLGETGKAYQARCRRILQTRLALNPAQLHQFFHTSLGDDLLTRVEHFIHLSGDRDRHPLKDLLLQMAADPEGVSLPSFLRHSPDIIRLSPEQLLLTRKQIEMLLQATNDVIAMIQSLAIAETQTASVADFSSLIDIRQPGQFAVKRHSLILTKQQESPEGSGDRSPLHALCYQPQPLPVDQVPVVVQSHGLASHPDDLAAYAEHLASHGYFVIAPQHRGSDTERVRNMLAGESQEVFELTEFVDRPLDISFLLDELERRNDQEFEGKLNLKTVGVMGYSFGAYTAFALAGAEIHFEGLEITCRSALENPNISLLLQCQALGLPRQSYSLYDERIQALVALDSIGSEVFGEQGIEEIQIPVLLIAGSQDATAPLAFEQIRIFDWLTSPQRYLALMQGKSHIQDLQRLLNTLDLQVKISPEVSLSPETKPFEQYIKALSLAFFNQHLIQQSNSIPYLNANYAAYISHTPFELWLISQASSQDFKQKLQELDNRFITAIADEKSA